MAAAPPTPNSPHTSTHSPPPPPCFLPQHNLSAVTNNWAAAQFFVEQARQNTRAFASPADLDAALIYNFSPRHGLSSNFEQIYFFPASQQ
jgi:hypothetical protein